MKKNQLFHLISVGSIALICTPGLAIEAPQEANPIPPQAPAIVPENIQEKAVNEIAVAEEQVQAEPQQQAERHMTPPPPAVIVEEPQADEAAPDRPYLGLILDPVPEFLAQHLQLKAEEGLMVTEVTPDSPAARAGIQANDILVKIDGSVVNSVAAVRSITEAHQVGDQLEAELIHGGKHVTHQVTLAAIPEKYSTPSEMGYAEPLQEEDGVDDWFGRLADDPQKLLKEALDKGFGFLRDWDAEGGFSGDIMKRLRREVFKHGDRFGLPEEIQDGSFFRSTMRLKDEEGRVEMRAGIDGVQAKVFDNHGQVVWEGPYETAQEKAAAPEDVRRRLDKLDFDGNFNFEGGFGEHGFRFGFGSEGFRDLHELNPQDRGVPRDQ